MGVYFLFVLFPNPSFVIGFLSVPATLGPARYPVGVGCIAVIGVEGMGISRGIFRSIEIGSAARNSRYADRLGIAPIDVARIFRERVNA